MLNPYQSYIHLSRYSRWDDALGRRETWPETVDRLIGFYKNKFPEHTEILSTLREAIVSCEVMPSMRSMMAAGPALDRDNMTAYNCAFIAVDYVDAFAEALHTLMCGTGVGFSCERQGIHKLPEVPEVFALEQHRIVVADSKEGWAHAYRMVINSLYSGKIPDVDYSHVRPAGARLKIFGGRASGPAPLKKLFDFTTNIFLGAQGRRLTSLEVHDIMCVVGEVVVVGGVRRAALISLSNLSDDRMRHAKSGDWRKGNPQRDMANNSAVYTDKPDVDIFMEEWLSLMKSKSGERGIFNREAAQKQASRWGRRSADIEYGCNPCSEILLRSRQVCNLSEVIIRQNDDEDSLRRKVQLATILGTFQATLTKFGFVSAEWIRNTEEERLLGVSLTGIYDNPLTSECSPKTAAMLNRLRDYAREVNQEWSSILGIPESAAITCVKPSGTVSELCGTASGIHQRHSKFYLRTTRLDKKDPIFHFLKDSGLYIEDEAYRPNDTAVVYFPVEAPGASVTRDDVTALEHLDLWLMYQRDWCEHKPSVTISVKDSEWLKVGAWVYENFDECSGVSFLPHDGGSYVQAPYQSLTHEQFLAWLDAHPQPVVDWSLFPAYESSDNTVASQTLACTGNNCSL